LPNKDKFRSYDYTTDLRIDQFLGNFIRGEATFDQLWQVLVLSHGQATVERAFSVNKGVYQQKVKEDSFIAQRIVSDYVNHASGVQHVPITKKLLASAAGARSK